MASRLAIDAAAGGKGTQVRRRDVANLVSIDWSVEEFRRLISEQSKSSDAGSSVEKTVDVLNFEIVPTSETIDRVPILENASSRAAEAASERSVSLLATQVVTQKKDRSSDPTVADVMALTALQAAGSDKPISSPEADRVTLICNDLRLPDERNRQQAHEKYAKRESEICV